jgi:hypothetical protein
MPVNDFKLFHGGQVRVRESQRLATIVQVNSQLAGSHQLARIGAVAGTVGGVLGGRSRRYGGSGTSGDGQTAQTRSDPLIQPLSSLARGVPERTSADICGHFAEGQGRVSRSGRPVVRMAITG